MREPRREYWEQTEERPEYDERGVLNDEKPRMKWYSATTRFVGPEGSQAHGFESWLRSECR
ncbi:hypothetical protein E2C01_068902 [Portunus trituberculatus]|uniref:Uncharacterized protein n=1 Tax=Portunus trituberculatus TaxID=210409 RepID=A0A5B7HT91_PORTR|nr:hypothetical protein [Portunus trituberculatus]